MDIERLPLKTRLDRLKNGYSAHVEHPPRAVLDMAHTPLRDYFSIVPEALGDLSEVEDADWEELTVAEAAHLISRMCSGEDGETREAARAAAIMAEPLRVLYQQEQEGKGGPA